MLKKYLTVALILLSTVVCVSCTSKSDADKALHDQGFSSIKITGYSWFACSEDDFYHTGFTATNAEGHKVSGTVCSGLLFKGSTIRY